MSGKTAKKTEEIRRSQGILDEAESMGTNRRKRAKALERKQSSDEDLDLDSIP